MDKLKEKYFSSPGEFAKAMNLFMEHQLYEQKTFAEYEGFMSLIEDDQWELIERAREYYEAIGSHYEQKFRNNNPSISSDAKPNYSPNEDPKLSTLIQKWLDEKRNGLRPSSFASTTQRITMFQSLLIEQAGFEPTISKITEGMIREYRNSLSKLPKIRNSKIHKGKSPLQLIQLNIKPAISPKSFREYTNDASEFIRWAEDNGYPANQKLARILSVVKKSTKKDKITRLPFNDEDLEKIFNSRDYISGDFRLASDYWLPLIGLFTGARIGEICQLDVTDIYKTSEGIWIFDINDENDKSVKSDKGSIRQMPVHPTLIELGLLEYRAEIEKANHEKLFPEEERDSVGKYSAISKRFTYLMKKLGISTVLAVNQSKSFHSFRHTIRTKLVDADIKIDIIDSIVGHTSEKRSVGDTTYTHTQRIRQKANAMSKLSYPVKFDLIRNWRGCTFSRVAGA